jgi:Flp pilus assembly protein TadD
LKQYDTAVTLFRIAEGLSPNRVRNLSNLAVAHQYRGELDEAEKIYLDVISLDTTIAEIPYNLARIYKERGHQARYEKYLRLAASRQIVPDIVLREAIVLIVKSGNLMEAAECYNSHPAIWTDTAFRYQLTTHFPDIVPMLTDTISFPDRPAPNPQGE